MYTAEKGIHHGKQTPPVEMFLNEMALRYPKYNFCGVNCAFPSAMARDMVAGYWHYDKLMNAVDSLKSKAVFGGVVIEHGYIEGKDSVNAAMLDREIIRLVEDIRERYQDSKLPCLVGRYEELCSGDKNVEQYRKYSDIVISKINSVSRLKNYALFPVRNNPREYMCEDHHYSCEGQRLTMRDAACIYQIFNFDRWAR